MILLRLVEGGRDLDAGDVFRHRYSRPGEIQEPVCVDGSSALVEFSRVAIGLGLPVELAFALAVERLLALDDLMRQGRNEEKTRDFLSGRAASTAFELPLGELKAAYVRTLLHGQESSRAAPVSDGAILTVPSRLSERVSNLDLSRVLEPGNLKEAVSWELAAVVQGRTLSEWVFLEVSAQIQQNQA